MHSPTCVNVFFKLSGYCTAYSQRVQYIAGFILLAPTVIGMTAPCRSLGSLHPFMICSFVTHEIRDYVEISSAQLLRGPGRTMGQLG